MITSQLTSDEQAEAEAGVEEGLGGFPGEHQPGEAQVRPRLDTGSGLQKTGTEGTGDTGKFLF